MHALASRACHTAASPDCSTLSMTYTVNFLSLTVLTTLAVLPSASVTVVPLAVLANVTWRQQQAARQQAAGSRGRSQRALQGAAWPQALARSHLLAAVCGGWHHGLVALGKQRVRAQVGAHDYVIRRQRVGERLVRGQVRGAEAVLLEEGGGGLRARAGGRGGASAMCCVQRVTTTHAHACTRACMHATARLQRASHTACEPRPWAPAQSRWRSH